jgi:uncharacterized membrane protein YdjX (TVP38/TMEM64 family)
VWGWLVVGLTVLIVAAGLVIWRAPLLELLANRDRLLSAIRDAGPTGPLLLIGLVVLQVVIAPFPGQVVNFAAGYLYGFWLGSLYSWLGLVLGSALAMSIARIAGRPLVSRILNAATMDRLDRIAEGKGLRFFFLVFLLPFMPDDLACFLAGLTRLPLAALIAVAALGRIPGILTAVWVGAEAGTFSPEGWLVAGVLVAAGVLLTWRYGERLQEALLRYVSRRS